ncbi:phage holin [Mycolicibacterium mageritense]|uniref:phage holin n=1 Tax=Mycolicibacterium mageritense TaxID=53462 RepID=UPI001E3DFB71|nr:hypothetical protein [Mycolicibacterium mageritense]MCC9182552.1 hypothetical protein [Mycolicibacterium mageritense]
MKLAIPSPKTRQYLYNVATVAAPLLVVYGVIDAGTLGLWLAVAGAILGLGATGQAAINLKQQRDNGTL